MRQTAIGFQSKKLTLEGILTTPTDLPGPHPALAVCHAHPMLGGSMNQPLIAAICAAASEQGFATLRFNFRGVGESQGTFSNGEGEQDDAASALGALRRWPGLDRKRLALAGYSLGASVILKGFKHFKAASAFVLIAPPVAALRSSPILGDRRPKLFIAGQNDRVCSSAELQRVLDELRQPVQFAEIPGADHSLRGQEQAVAQRVAEFLARSLAG